MKETGFRYIFPHLSVLSFLAVCLSVCDYFPLNYCDVMREKGVKINVNTFLKFSLISKFNDREKDPRIINHFPSFFCISS